MMELPSRPTVSLPRLWLWCVVVAMWSVCGVGCLQKVPRACRNADDCKAMAPAIYCHQGICQERNCEPGQQETCYEGPEGTQGKGICRGGVRSCLENGRWSSCLGQRLPLVEICDRVDNDCNGKVDDAALSCDCFPSGNKRSCYPGPEGTLNRSECIAGVQYCETDNRWGACAGAVVPVSERCDGIDNDCDGEVDNHPSCICSLGESRACYTGPRKTRNIGACKDGIQTCENGQWGACRNEGLPKDEDCNTNDVDEDCDGVVNNGCSSTSLCPKDKPDSCDKQCVSLQTDSKHCGACGIACGAQQRCEQGVCVCPTGQTRCDGKCVVLSDNAEHCGGCGKACDNGNLCCDGQCVDAQASADNCGGCGLRCQNASCQKGQCIPTCENDTTFCSGQCVDTKTNPSHCGGCGKACSGKPCFNGTCGCKTDEALCDGVCFAVKSNPRHCGGCNNTCQGGKTCVNGACKCPEELGAFCNGECVNFENNAAHCGGCGKACAQGQACVKGTCLACPSQNDLCPKTSVCCVKPRQCHPTTGACLNLQDDSKNCGAVGTVCDAYSTCTKGKCQCITGVQRRCYPTTVPSVLRSPCRQGVQTCKSDGTWDNPQCSDAIVATTELCDNIDNDCNGSVDDGVKPPSPSTRCSSLFGVCAGAKEVCLKGAWTCDVGVMSGYEAKETSCDGKDNDCDGQIDEDPDVRKPCLNTKGVCAFPGAYRICINGVLSSCKAPAYESIETRCDGKDNDCDGLTDNGVACALPGYVEKSMRPRLVPNEQITALAAHPTLMIAVAGTRQTQSNAAYRSGRVVLWDILTGADIRELKDPKIKHIRTPRPEVAHAFSVRSAAFHPNGTLVATGGDDQRVQIFDVSTGALLRTLQAGTTELGSNFFRMGAVSLSFHPTKPEILVGYAPKIAESIPWSNTYVAIRWNYSNGKVLKTPAPLSHKGGVRSVAFGPLGNYAVTGGADGLVKVYATSDWKVTFTLPYTHTPIIPTSLNKIKPYGVSISVATQGDLVATSGDDGVIKVWDTKTRPWTVKHTMKTPLGSITGLQFRLKGDILYSVSDSDVAVRAWDIASERQVRLNFGHLWGINNLAVAADGRRVLTGPRSGIGVLVWSTPSTCFAEKNSSISSQLLRSTTYHTTPITHLELSKHGQFLLSLSRGAERVYVWNLNRLSQNPKGSRFNPSKLLQSAAFFPQPGGSTNMTWGLLDTLAQSNIYYDFSTSSLPNRASPPRPTKVAEIGFNPSNYLLTLAEGNDVTFFNRYIPNQGYGPYDTLLTKLQHSRPIKSISWSTDGTRLAVLLNNDTIQFWDVTINHSPKATTLPVTGTKIGTPVSFMSPVVSMSWHPEKHLFAVATNTRDVQLWDVTSATTAQAVSATVRSVGLPHKMSSVAFHPSGRHLLVGFDQGSLQLFHLFDVNGKLSPTEGRVLQNPTNSHTKTVSHIQVHPSGNRIVTAGGDNKIILWDCTP